MDKKSNLAWQCRLCAARKEKLINYYSKGKFHEHLQDCIKHVKDKDEKQRYQALLQKYLEEEARDSKNKRQRRDTEANQKKGPGGIKQLTINQFFYPAEVTDAAQRYTMKEVNAALARLVIDTQSPFAICERESFLAFIATLHKYFKDNPTISPRIPTSSTDTEPAAEQSKLSFKLPSQQTLAKNVDAVCDEAVHIFLSRGFAADVHRCGAGLSTDGRKDVNDRSNEVGYLLCGNTSILVKTVHVLGSKESSCLKSVWLEDMMKQDIRCVYDQPSYDLPVESLTKYIFYIVTDNAANSAKARRELQLTHGLLSVGCATHTMSLLPKHMVSKTTGVPYVQENIVLLEALTKVFHEWAIPKAMLREHHISLRRLVSTRFMYVHGALQHLEDKKCLEVLGKLMETDAFQKFARGRDSKDKAIIDKAREAVYVGKFAVFVKFFLELMTPWVNAMREFDRSRSNVHIIYPLMNELVNIASETFSSARFLSVDDLIKRDIAVAIHNFVRKFDSPVFAAAYALHPYFNETMRQLSISTEPDKVAQYKSILKCLLQVFTILAIRSPIEKGYLEKGMVAFPSPRNVDDAREVALTAVNEYRCEFLPRENDWRDAHGVFSVWRNISKVNPLQFFQRMAPSTSILRHFAVAILSIVPSVSATERGHKDNRDTLTASRNQLAPQRLDKMLRAKEIYASHRYRDEQAKSNQVPCTRPEEIYENLKKPIQMPQAAQAPPAAPSGTAPTAPGGADGEADDGQKDSGEGGSSAGLGTLNGPDTTADLASATTGQASGDESDGDEGGGTSAIRREQEEHEAALIAPDSVEEDEAHVDALEAAVEGSQEQPAVRRSARNSGRLSRYPEKFKMYVL